MSLLAIPGASTLFRCSNPSCKFKGDAVSLVSLVRGIPVRDALALFGEDGELHDCVPVPITSQEMEAYLANMESQATLRAYLSKCSQALRRAPEKSGLRAGLARSNLRMMHPDIGLFCTDEPDDVPRCLREFLKPKYRSRSLVLYPCSFNGDISRIEVTDGLDPAFRHTIVVTHPDTGVFGEDAGEVNDRLLAVERPDVAAKLFATYSSCSTRVPPIIAFRGYPLPETLRNVYNIYFLSFTDAPISERILLQTLSVPELKTGKPPTMRVVSFKNPVDQITFRDLDRLFKLGMDHMHTIQHFLALNLADMVEAGKPKEVLDLLAVEQAPTLVKNLVKDDAANRFPGSKANAGRKLIELLDSAPSGEPCNFTLANGERIHTGPDGISVIKPGGNLKAICNVGLTVETRLSLSGEFGEAFDCVATARGGFPAVKVRLGWRDLTAERMRIAVQQAYADMGLSPYVAFYTYGGIVWRDVVGKLAENCPVEKVKPLKFEKPVSSNEMKLGSIRNTEQ